MQTTTLDQQIVLLTLDPRGTFRDKYKTEFAAAGGVLLELALHGRIDVLDGKVTVVDPTPPGVPQLDAALVRIAASGRRPQSTRRWVRELRKPSFENAVAGLTRAGLLRSEQHRALGMVPVQRHPRTGEGAERAERALRKRLSEVVLGTAEPDPGTACLAILADSARLHRWAFPQTDARRVGERAMELTAVDRIAPAVRKAVTAVQREAAAAVTAGAAGAAAY